ncbi:MAG TPA: ABC transporter permease [Bryobacteraceae bacterium]|nr:ABC transporter permease [Bryobacteraceae bacterium]
MTLWAELRYAVRSLAKSPVFAAVAVVSMALGIGANTAVFSMLDHILLSPLPVRQPGELVQLSEVGRHYGSNSGSNALSYPIYEDFRDKNEVFSGVLCRALYPLSVSYAGANERATGELVSGSYFQVLGVGAALGRLFTAEEDRIPGGAPVAVLGYGYWKTRYAGDPSVIGKQILANDHQLTIIGVTEPRFEGADRLFTTQVYIPIMMAPQITTEDRPLENRRRRWVQVFARLKPGISRRDAQASLQPLFHQILEMEVRQKEFAKASAYSREQFLKMTLAVMPGAAGQDEGRQFLEAPLWAMMGMVALVLLIACANVANLMIARATGRQKEIALRLALGASRVRLVRQLLVESLLVSIAGGLLGLLILPPTTRLLVGIMPQFDPPLKFDAGAEPRVLLFSAAASLLTALFFGLTPALQATRPELAPTLKDQAGSLTGGPIRWRKLLAAAQVSLSLLLLIGAGLFMRSLQNIKNINPGFEVANLLSFAVDPTLSGYNAERARLFYRDLTRTLAELPGVQAAALCVVPPLSYNEWDRTVTVEGYASKPGEDMSPWFNYVSPGFFGALRIPIYAGRDFTERDSAGAAKVAIVNEKFARHYFGDAPAVGRHIGEGGDPGTKTDIEIIGVVRDTRYQTMRQEPPRQVFRPYMQNEFRGGGMTAYARTEHPPEQMFPELRAAVRKLDANMPVYLMKTEERQRDDSLAIEKLAASLSTAFGILATLLAGVGVYGVMAFVVARRTREIGIRMALGAMRGNVIWLVMREVLLLAGAGILIGLPVALAGTRLLANLLYGITPNDPGTLVAATLGIAAIAALSGYFPARRATRVDPVFAIRCE